MTHYSVAFADEKLKRDFDRLENGPFHDQQLRRFLNRAMDDLSQNPWRGVPISKKLWPREYLDKFHIDNLRKYDLPMGWRLIYTLRGGKVDIVSVLIEWFDHTNYERRFKY